MKQKFRQFASLLLTMCLVMGLPVFIAPKETSAVQYAGTSSAPIAIMVTDNPRPQTVVQAADSGLCIQQQDVGLRLYQPSWCNTITISEPIMRHASLSVSQPENNTKVSVIGEPRMQSQKSLKPSEQNQAKALLGYSYYQEVQVVLSFKHFRSNVYLPIMHHSKNILSLSELQVFRC